MKTILSNILFVYFIFSSYVIYANPTQEELIEKKIIESNNIQLWNKLLEDVVLSEKFKKHCQMKSPKSEKEWVKTFDNIVYWDNPTKLYVLKAIKTNLPKVSFSDILNNKLYNPFTINEILDIVVGGTITEDKQGNIQMTEDENMKEVLTNRAIKLIKENTKELHTLIKRRDGLIKEQSNKIDKIESNIKNSKKEVIEATKNIEKAKDLQKCSNCSRKYIIFIILLGILLVIYFFKKNRK